LLLLLLQVLGDEFSQLGCKVFFSFDDSDREAAYWAKENKAFAVITDDTDFMCYEGVDRLWSANIKLPTGEGWKRVLRGSMNLQAGFDVVAECTDCSVRRGSGAMCRLISGCQEVRLRG
jgi:hypothetical protein